MCEYLVLYLFATVAISLLGKSSSIRNCGNISMFIKDVSLLNVHISNGKIQTHVGVRNQVECGRLCYRHSECRSFFFNEVTAICQTNSVIYLSTAGSVADEGTIYFKKKTDCPAPPSVLNAEPQFDMNSAPNITGTVLDYLCNTGYTQQGNVMCQDGTWTQMSCNKVLRSCSEVRQCNDQYKDGEYWIYPTTFGNSRAKIYCHLMTSTPTEYVTLRVVNRGYYPPTSNKNCNFEISLNTTEFSETTLYNKIRVGIQTMKVNRADPTFATTTFGKFQKYGEAADCYTGHYNGNKSTCGPKGTFNIDTTGTGLIVSKSLQFPSNGWQFWGQAVRNADGSKVDLLCGGSCGWCKPSGAMLLELNTPDGPPGSDAIVPTCV